MGGRGRARDSGRGVEEERDKKRDTPLPPGESERRMEWGGRGEGGREGEKEGGGGGGSVLVEGEVRGCFKRVPGPESAKVKEREGMDERRGERGRKGGEAVLLRLRGGSRLSAARHSRPFSLFSAFFRLPQRTVHRLAACNISVRFLSFFFLLLSLFRLRRY